MKLAGPSSFLLGSLGSLIAIQLATAERSGTDIYTSVSVAALLAAVATFLFAIASIILRRFAGYRVAFLLGMACSVSAALAGWWLAFNDWPAESVFRLSLGLFVILPLLSPLLVRRRPGPKG